MFEGKPLYYTSEFQGNKEKADEPDDVVVPQYKDVEDTKQEKYDCTTQYVGTHLV